METTLKIAIQKKGRLSEKSLELFKKCGIKFSSKGSLKMHSSNFPIELLLLRDDDIPEYVETGVADLGMVGQNEVYEKTDNVNELKELGFGKCRLSIAVRNRFEYNSIQDLDGSEIATSYPVILKKYLKEQGVNAKVHEISGSVEIAPSIGLADAVCDIVSTGSTLLMNGLKEVEPFMKSQAVLIGRPDMPEEKQKLVDQLLYRMNAVQKAGDTKYILLNAPNDRVDEICAVLPGMKSPTVLPLADKGWSSVHSVVKENEFWDVIEKLEAYGAQGILVMPIEKMFL